MAPQDHRRRNRILAGMAGGALGGLPAFVVINSYYIACFLVDANLGPTSIDPPLFVDALCRMGLGGILGTLIGTLFPSKLDNSPRVSFWATFAVGCFISFCCILPPQGVRE